MKKDFYASCSFVSTDGFSPYPLFNFPMAKSLINDYVIILMELIWLGINDFIALYSRSAKFNFINLIRACWSVNLIISPFFQTIKKTFMTSWSSRFNWNSDRTLFSRKNKINFHSFATFRSLLISTRVSWKWVFFVVYVVCFYNVWKIESPVWRGSLSVDVLMKGPFSVVAKILFTKDLEILRHLEYFWHAIFKNILKSLKITNKVFFKHSKKIP